jgi:hypothetical protein
VSFHPHWTPTAAGQYAAIRAAALQPPSKTKTGGEKASRQQGLFKQVHKCIQYLLENPRHPSLHTHEFTSLPHPWTPNEKVFEAYAQNRTPGAYRVFWCYGPGQGDITIIAITPHP